MTHKDSWSNVRCFNKKQLTFYRHNPVPNRGSPFLFTYLPLAILIELTREPRLPREFFRRYALARLIHPDLIEQTEQALRFGSRNLLGARVSDFLDHLHQEIILFLIKAFPWLPPQSTWPYSLNPVSGQVFGSLPRV